MDFVGSAMYYKYRTCSSRTWDLLKKHEVYFSLPGDLNDPLDVSIDVKSEYERARVMCMRLTPTQRFASHF